MVARTVNSFGPPLASDQKRHAFPTPAQIAAVSLDEFAELARMGYRNASVHKIAVEIAEGRLDIESWNEAAIGGMQTSE